MEKLMKNLFKVMKTIPLAAGLAFAASAIAHDHSDSEKPKNVVTADTPDKVLLAGKNQQAMAKVLKPSTRLTLEIEGVEHAITMSSYNGQKVLHTPHASEEDIESIRSAYAEISNTEDFKVVSAPLNDDSAE
jgi:hypothetical protein